MLETLLRRERNISEVEAASSEAEDNSVKRPLTASDEGLKESLGGSSAEESSQLRTGSEISIVENLSMPTFD